MSGPANYQFPAELTLEDASYIHLQGATLAEEIARCKNLIVTSSASIIDLSAAQTALAAASFGGLHYALPGTVGEIRVQQQQIGATAAQTGLVYQSTPDGVNYSTFYTVAPATAGSQQFIAFQTSTASGSTAAQNFLMISVPNATVSAFITLSLAMQTSDGLSTSEAEVSVAISRSVGVASAINISAPFGEADAVCAGGPTITFGTVTSAAVSANTATNVNQYYLIATPTVAGGTGSTTTYKYGTARLCSSSRANAITIAQV